jgi:hypothetical protein
MVLSRMKRKRAVRIARTCLTKETSHLSSFEMSAMTKKERVEIPAEIAARVLFLSDRTCCVCRVIRKPVQIHHMDEDPSNSIEERFR